MSPKIPGGSEDLLSIWHSARLPVLLALIVIFVGWKARSLLHNLQRQETAHIGKTFPTLSDKKSQDTPKSAVGNVKPSGRKQSPKRVTGGTVKGKKGALNQKRNVAQVVDTEFDTIQPIIFYASLTTTTAGLAETLHSTLFKNPELSAYQTYSIPTASNAPKSELPRKILEPQLCNLEEIELDDYFISLPAASPNLRYIYLVIVPTYDPQEQSPAYAFIQHLEDTHHDFRIDSSPLQRLGGFSVFGVGDSSEWGDAERFCRDAKQADKWLGKLTGGRAGASSRRIFPIGFADCNPHSEGKGDIDAQLQSWAIHLEEAIREYAITGELGESAGSRAAVESGDEDSDVDIAEDNAEDEGEAMVDVEDIGRILNKSKKANDLPDGNNGILAVDFTTQGKTVASVDAKEMVPKNGPTYNALTKQGYAIVGSHSGVKICRWTKSALRGRGSCYKFSFYGIKSHLCMETTPSLSCSNKCVFCWRHGTNPVGTTWRWKVDAPDDIFRGVVEGHYKKIKMMKGVPGVRADRFAEAFRIRHCALSLVGEPIFYPYINEFLALLHGSRISSFLVCNAQHPDQLAALKHVTQLYVSIDASNRDSLKRIDRPLHRDFWERFQRCLEILREKRNTQRTVFRLTLVKGFNIESEISGYADLIEKGLPCFVEIKGVTYCGTSTSSKAGLTMENVPFYEEIVTFVEALNVELERRKLGYGIAAEHAHSCCVLLASNRFKIEGKWHTKIDYARFFELLESGVEFGPEDYIGEETPEWATWGNGGFDPADERVYRKGKNKKPLPVPKEEKEAEVEEEVKEEVEEEEEDAVLVSREDAMDEKLARVELEF
ncbi:hypothetical protein DFH27DRAFT_590200 [Peziza echinospora]|nr:hypothetical protein DFH27DRAFT_590200 [Peziza echinospora]